MNILIIKTGALGDVVRTSFIAQALKNKYQKKKPHIFWLTDKKAVSFFINNPYIDKVIESKDAVKGVNFDIIINLEEDQENCKFASSFKSREIIGFFWEDGKVVPSKSAMGWFNMSALGKKPNNDLLKKENKKTHRQIMSEIIGVDYKKYEPFLRLNRKQREIAGNFLRRHGISRKDIIIGINTGAADRWPKALSIEKTVNLINELHKRYKARFLLFGGINEIERNKKILELANAPIIDTGCGNDLIEFPALLSVCTLVISSDSLGLHIALALKRKTICLIGPTSSAEIGLYDLGEKVVADSSCLCCYNKDCKSMEKISVDKILAAVKKLLKQKIVVVITAFKEKKVGKAIESALNQKTNQEYEVVISAPDKETLDIARKYSKKDKRVKIFKDPGRGKSYALNILFKKIKADILILTDGDVSIGNKAVEEIISLFSDPEIGCVSGRPVPVENRNNKYGFWAHFLFDSAHRMREEAFRNNSFIECSGYLFAFRKNKINEIPLDVAEDSVIPYYFWEKGYRIGYAENAEVFVKNADNFADWIKQKTRTSKAHETLDKYADTRTTTRVKNFATEAKGIKWLFRYPSNLMEVFWSIQLVFARAYMWMEVHIDTKFKNKQYSDAWERVGSTK